MVIRSWVSMLIPYKTASFYGEKFLVTRLVTFFAKLTMVCQGWPSLFKAICLILLNKCVLAGNCGKSPKKLPCGWWKVQWRGCLFPFLFRFENGWPKLSRTVWGIGLFWGVERALIGLLYCCYPCLCIDLYGWEDLVRVDHRCLKGGGYLRNGPNWPNAIHQSLEYSWSVCGCWWLEATSQGGEVSRKNQQP